jgi:hypothetical protein
MVAAPATRDDWPPASSRPRPVTADEDYSPITYGFMYSSTARKVA